MIICWIMNYIGKNWNYIGRTIREQQHELVSDKEYSIDYPEDLIFHNPSDISILYNKFHIILNPMSNIFVFGQN